MLVPSEVIDEQLGLNRAKPCAPALSRRRVDVPMVEKFILMWTLSKYAVYFVKTSPRLATNYMICCTAKEVDVFRNEDAIEKLKHHDIRA